MLSEGLRRREYTVVAGDTATKICREFRCTLEQFYEMNKQLIRNGRAIPYTKDASLVPGDRCWVPSMFLSYRVPLGGIDATELEE